jgi:hypothetical protein
MGRGNSFLLYQDTVPVEVREEIKGRLLEAEMHGYEKFIAAAQYIMAEVLAGQIPPDVAKEARAYLELILTAISAKNIVEAKNGQGTLPTTSAVAEQLKAAQSKAKKMRLELTDHGTGDIEVEMQALKSKVTK